MSGVKRTEAPICVISAFANDPWAQMTKSSDETKVISLKLPSCGEDECNGEWALKNSVFGRSLVQCVGWCG